MPTHLGIRKYHGSGNGLIDYTNKAADVVVPKVTSGLQSIDQFLDKGVSYPIVKQAGAYVLDKFSTELNTPQSNPVSQLAADYLKTDLAENIGRPILEAAGLNKNAVGAALAIPALLGMVRGRSDVINLKKLSANDLATGNYANSVEKAFAKGQRQYVKNGEVMDAGWKKANFGTDLYETGPFNPARRRERAAERRARQLEGTATLEMFVEAWGDEVGSARYTDYKKALLNIYKHTDPARFDVDHISSLKYTPVHHPVNMRLQNKHRNRSEGARELDSHRKQVLLLADNIQDQIRLQGPLTTPYQRQKILRGS